MSTELDLQEKTRMQDTYHEVEEILDRIGKLRVFPPLVWVWTWDVARSIWTDIMEGGDPEYCTAKDEEEMWELFWTQADKNGFSLTYGDEDLYEHVRDWMFDQGIIEVYDGDLDEDQDDMIESEEEEV